MEEENKNSSPNPRPEQDFIGNGCANIQNHNQEGSQIPKKENINLSSFEGDVIIQIRKILQELEESLEIGVNNLSAVDRLFTLIQEESWVITRESLMQEILIIFSNFGFQSKTEDLHYNAFIKPSRRFLQIANSQNSEILMKLKEWFLQWFKDLYNNSEDQLSSLALLTLYFLYFSGNITLDDFHTLRTIISDSLQSDRPEIKNEGVNILLCGIRSYDEVFRKICLSILSTNLSLVIEITAQENWKFLTLLDALKSARNNPECDFTPKKEHIWSILEKDIIPLSSKCYVMKYFATLPCLQWSEEERVVIIQIFIEHLAKSCTLSDTEWINQPEIHIGEKPSGLEKKLNEDEKKALNIIWNWISSLQTETISTMIQYFLSQEIYQSDSRYHYALLLSITTDGKPVFGYPIADAIHFVCASMKHDNFKVRNGAVHAFIDLFQYMKSEIYSSYKDQLASVLIQYLDEKIPRIQTLVLKTLEYLFAKSLIQLSDMDFDALLKNLLCLILQDCDAGLKSRMIQILVQIYHSHPKEFLRYLDDILQACSELLRSFVYKRQANSQYDPLRKSIIQLVSDVCKKEGFEQTREIMEVFVVKMLSKPEDLKFVNVGELNIHLQTCFEFIQKYCIQNSAKSISLLLDWLEALFNDLTNTGKSHFWHCCNTYMIMVEQLYPYVQNDIEAIVSRILDLCKISTLSRHSIFQGRTVCITENPGIIQPYKIGVPWEFQDCLWNFQMKFIKKLKEKTTPEKYEFLMRVCDQVVRSLLDILNTFLPIEETERLISQLREISQIIGFEFADEETMHKYWEMIDRYVYTTEDTIFSTILELSQELMAKFPEHSQSHVLRIIQSGSFTNSQIYNGLPQHYIARNNFILACLRNLSSEFITEIWTLIGDQVLGTLEENCPTNVKEEYLEVISLTAAKFPEVFLWNDSYYLDRLVFYAEVPMFQVWAEEAKWWKTETTIALGHILKSFPSHPYFTRISRVWENSLASLDQSVRLEDQYEMMFDLILEYPERFFPDEDTVYDCLCNIFRISELILRREPNSKRKTILEKAKQVLERAFGDDHLREIICHDYVEDTPREIWKLLRSI